MFSLILQNTNDAFCMTETVVYLQLMSITLTIFDVFDFYFERSAHVYVRVQEGVAVSVSGSSAAAASCRLSQEALTVWAKGKYAHYEA